MTSSYVEAAVPRHLLERDSAGVGPSALGREHRAHRVEACAEPVADAFAASREDHAIRSSAMTDSVAPVASEPAAY